MRGLKLYFKKYQDTLPLAFRLSQRGFSIHNDDEVIPTEVIIQLLVLSNQENKDE